MISNYHAALKFDEIVSDPEKRDALASIFPAEVMANLPRWTNVIVQDEFQGGAQKELFEIVREGDDHHRFENVLHRHNEDINTFSEHEMPLFHFVIEAERPSILRCLLDRADLDLNFRDSFGYTPLMNAVGDVMEVLLKDERVDVNAVDNGGGTALHMTVFYNEVERVCNLLKRADLDVNKFDAFGEIALFNCFAGPHSVAKQLVIFDTLLSDPRTVLSHRDDRDHTIKYHVSRLGVAQRTQAHEILREHEEVRLQRAKKQVKILKDWRVEIDPGNEKYLPDDVLSKYVLPYAADVLSPLEEIGDITL